MMGLGPGHLVHAIFTFFYGNYIESTPVKTKKSRVYDAGMTNVISREKWKLHVPDDPDPDPSLSDLSSKKKKRDKKKNRRKYKKDNSS